MNVNLISAADFQGKVALPDDPETTGLLESYIEASVSVYLQYLLGETLYMELLLDVGSAEQESSLPLKWHRLIHGDTYEVDGHQRQYHGLKAMLCHFVYVAFVRDYNKHASAMGLVVSDTDTASQAERQELASVLQSRYNEAVGMYHSAQRYIESRNAEDPSLYPDYQTTVLEAAYLGGWL